MDLSSRVVLLASSALASLGVFTFAAAQVPKPEEAARRYQLSAPLCVPDKVGEGEAAWSHRVPAPMQSQRRSALD